MPSPNLALLSESLAQAILSNKITGSELDAYLNTSDGYKAWSVLLKSRNLPIIFRNPTALALLFASGVAVTGLLAVNGAALAASDSATEAICTSTGALLTIVKDATLMDLWQNNSANKARMEAQVNAVGSKLRRTKYTSNTTWINPAEGVVALGFFGPGHGGSGAYGSNGAGGGGGGGAEVKWGFMTVGLPTTNVAITISSSTSFGSFFTVANGGTGSNQNGGTGGGSTTGDSPYDTDYDNSLFQIKTGSQRGGNGGYGASNSSGGQSGNPGSAGYSGSGGLGGVGQTSGGFNGFGGAAGSGMGSGGGGGAKSSYNYNGNSAGPHGNGAGGGAANRSGGTGSDGFLVVNEILGEAA